MKRSLRPLSGLTLLLSAAAARAQAPLYDLAGPPNSEFGYSIASVPDVDGDGAGYLVVGAPWHDYVLGQNHGAVYTISGSNGAQIWKFGGNASDDLFGYAVAAPGDMDGDGGADYAFSIPYSDQIVQDGGLVWVHSGAAMCCRARRTGWWYRDPGLPPPFSVGLTNGIALHVLP